MKSFLFRAASGLLFFFSLIPFSRRRSWWVRGFDFPRLQIAAMSAVVGVSSSLSKTSPRDRLVTGALSLGTLVLQLGHVIPYTFLFRKQVKHTTRIERKNTFSMLVVNVLMPNRNADLLLDVVNRERPDLLLVMEPDAWWHGKLKPLWPQFPHRVCRPQSNTYGMELFSRFDLISPRVEERLEKGVPSISTRVKLPSGVEFELRCVHPKPPSPHEAASSTPRDSELLMVGREVADSKVPVVVAGDLNDVAWSHSTRLFQRTSHLLDPRRGRWLLNTYNAKIPLVRWPLDHFFHSRCFTLGEIKRLPAIGSDHFPIFVKLTYEPEAARHHPMPTADQDDKEEALDVLQDARDR